MRALTFTLTPADLTRYRIVMLRRAIRFGGIEAFDKQSALALTVILGLALVIGWSIGFLGAGIAFAIGLVLGLVAQAILQNLRQARLTRVAEQDALFAGEQSVTLDDTGLSVDGTRFRSFFAWDTVRGLVEEDRLVIVLLTASNGVVVPASAFANDAEKSAFVAMVKARAAG
jgi:small-conductance mechanosensitive channel